MALFKGVIASVLMVANIILCAIPLFALTILKLLIPIKSIRNILNRGLNIIAETWIYGNSGWMWLTQKLDWQVDVPDQLQRHGWYFVLANHQSWVDIFVLQRVLTGKIPFLKFFLKHELIHVPIMGAAWWALDFPFMKRYSPAYLKKHPEKKGKDLETTKVACEKFKDLPTSVVNFLEGTRFTPEKHAQQNSPFKNLLKPKAGGMAFAMNAMGDQFKSILDVSIVYPDKVPTFWEFMQGKMDRCKVIVTEYEIPEALREGDYGNDVEYRQLFQTWLTSVWEAKDKQLESMVAQ